MLLQHTRNHWLSDQDTQRQQGMRWFAQAPSTPGQRRDTSVGVQHQTATPYPLCRAGFCSVFAAPAVLLLMFSGAVCACCCRLKRAGLDYWEHVCVQVHDSWEVGGTG